MSIDEKALDKALQVAFFEGNVTRDQVLRVVEAYEVAKAEGKPILPKQEPLGAEFTKVLDENFSELLVRDWNDKEQPDGLINRVAKKLEHYITDDDIGKELSPASRVKRRQVYAREMAEDVLSVIDLPKRESVAIEALKEISIKGYKSGFSRVAMANIAKRALSEIEGGQS